MYSVTSRRLRWSLTGAAMLLSAPLVLAQEAPAPPAAPTTGEAVTLVYKFQPGAIRKLRAGGTLDMSISMDGGAAGLGPIPLTIKIALDLTEKVAGVKDGVGTIASKLERATMDTNVMGTNVAMKMANGKTTTTMNGQPMQSPPGASPAMMQQFSGAPVVVRRDARGNETPVTGRDLMTQLLGSGATSVVQLPANPVRPGESWEVSTKVRPNVPGNPVAAGMPMPELEMKLTHTLRSIESRNGKQFALIDTVGTGSMPAGAAGMLREMSQSFTGTTRFDIRRGVIVSGQFSSDMGMKMAMPRGLGAPGAAPGAAPPDGAAPEGAAPGGEAGAAPGAMRIDGALKINLVEVPAAPARPAAKPATKRPARKR